MKRENASWAEEWKEITKSIGLPLGPRQAWGPSIKDVHIRREGEEGVGEREVAWIIQSKMHRKAQEEGNVQSSAIRWAPGCVNVAGKPKQQKW